MKKFFLILCAIFFGFFATPNVIAEEYQIMNLSDANGYISEPDINDKGKIVWVENDGAYKYQVVLYDIATATAIIVANGRVVSENYRAPQINNNGQVFYVKVTLLGGGKKSLQFYLYEINTATTTELNLDYEQPPPNTDPSIYFKMNDNGQVVWVNRSKIFFYDIATKETTLLTNHNFTALGINNSKVFWAADGEIFLYDIATATTTQLTYNAYIDYLPQISNNGKVVWYRFNYGIFLYDIETTITTQITENTLDQFPQINDNGKVVFHREGYGIFIYDIATTTIMQIDNSDFENIQIDNNDRVLWSRKIDHDWLLAIPINNSGDNCPNDPNKTDPGVCDCGIPETDTDSDGEPDCTDADDDGDGMPDVWEEQYSVYDGSPCLNPLVVDADDDCDGDGFSNIGEYDAETVPNNTDSKPNQPPTAPSLSLPVNNDINVEPIGIFLQWSPSTDLDDGDTIKYCVTIKEDGNPNDILVYSSCDMESFISETSFSPPTIFDDFERDISPDDINNFFYEPGKKYWWAVWAIDDKGNWSESSEWWSFTIKDVQLDNTIPLKIIMQDNDTSQNFPEPEGWNLITKFMNYGAHEKYPASYVINYLKAICIYMQKPIGNLQIISHGDFDYLPFFGNNLCYNQFASNGAQRFDGKDPLKSDPLNSIDIFKEEFESLKPYLSGNNDENTLVELYACLLAGSDDGKMLVNKISMLTGCCVNSSIDYSVPPTMLHVEDYDAAEFGINIVALVKWLFTDEYISGDWRLEYQVCPEDVRSMPLWGYSDDINEVFPEGVAIHIDMGALIPEGHLYVTNVTDSIKTLELKSNNWLVSSAYDITLDGTQLNEGYYIRISLPYEITIAGINSSLIEVKYWDSSLSVPRWNDSRIFDVVVDEENHIVTFSTDHNSIFAVLIDKNDIDDDGDGYTENEGDYDDTNLGIHPGAEEIPNNGIDEDCNGEDLIDTTLLDQDGDGYTPAQGDHDDINPGVNPGLTEICNDGLDNDCDGQIDEGCESYGKVALDLGSAGFWIHDGTSWSQITTFNVIKTEPWSRGLVVDLGTPYGQWNFNGTAWNMLLSNLNTDVMTSWTKGLALDFGSIGLYNHNGSSFDLPEMTSFNPVAMKSWANGLAVDLSPYGLFNHNGTSWTAQLTGLPTENMVSWQGGLACDFGAVYGLFTHNGTSWNWISTSNPENMVSWSRGLAVDFGVNGLWNYDGQAWSKISNLNPTSLTKWSNGLAVGFGSSGLYTYDGQNWSYISNWNPENSNEWGGVLTVDFGSNGVFIFNGFSWNKLLDFNAEGISVVKGN